MECKRRKFDRADRYVDLTQDFKHLKIFKYLGTYFKCLKIGISNPGS